MIARMTRICRSILLVALAGVLATPARTLAGRDIVDGWERGYYPGGVPMPAKESWAAYYLAHAQVDNGPEKRLPSGVRWRLATDRLTGIAMPRIAWMPDNRRLNIANQMLEMAHGGAMLFSNQQEKALREYVRDDIPRKPLPKRVIAQSDVALTYASDRFVSLIDLGSIYTYEGTYIPRIIRGITLDLERQQFFTMEACPEGSLERPNAIANPTFRFADLLDICDRASLERFGALVQAADDRAKSSTATSKDPLVQHCRKAPLEYEQEFVVYLAETGLAVHLLYFWVIADIGTCTLTLTARNPVIVPYRELEPLMKPGSLREELLRAK